MSRTDLISDSLACLKNGAMAKKDSVVIPYSKVILNICEILKSEGYIENFRKIEEGKKDFINVYLKYKHKQCAFLKIRRISKPSRRRYVGKSNVPYVLRGKGLACVSTSVGLLTDRQTRKQGLGGEVLFYIW
ncbi:30S ribosomal protein S8 [Candidatus Omnitrophota bacterium]